MSESLKSFMDIWHASMLYGSILIFLIGIIILVVYYIRYNGQKELKDKYDFASRYEIKYHRMAHILFAIALTMILNTLRPDLIEKGFVLFFVRLSITIVAGTIYGYVASLVLKFYYPTKLSEKLKKLRYTPRVSSQTGNKMRLLSEEEEDVYLDEGQQAEEEAFSVDYDVWIDSETGETRIEKYMGHLAALKCDRCGFVTLKMEREELVKEPTEFEEGELVQHYKCSYCGRIKRDSKTIAKRGASINVPDSPTFVDPLAGVSVTNVMVEIHGSNGEVKNYEFQNTHQAEMFLKEFDFAKVED